MTQKWDVFLERADGNEDARFLTQLETVTQSEAIHEVATFYALPEHDLIARPPITTVEMAIHRAQLDAPKIRARRPRINATDIWDQAMMSFHQTNIPMLFGQEYMQAFVDEYTKTRKPLPTDQPITWGIIPANEAKPIIISYDGRTFLVEEETIHGNGRDEIKGRLLNKEEMAHLLAIIEPK